MTWIERFWAKVDRRGPDECWPWRATITDAGYGQFWLEGRMVGAHRTAYELLVGPVPKGLELDHVKERGCTSRACCNPAHLEPVTTRENVLRGDGPSAKNARRTHCAKGHEYHVTKSGRRQCRICQTDRMRAWRAGRG